MRFMVIVKANADSEAGVMPSTEELAAMGKFNEELVNAGIMLAGEGLHPSSAGARVRFDAEGRSTVVDGPFAETKELIAGFWILQTSIEGRGPRVGQEDPDDPGPAVRDRGPAGLRRRGLRRRAHARAARAGRAAARTDPGAARELSGRARRPSRGRRRLADGVGPGHLRTGPHGARRRARRGPGAGGAGRRARDVAAVGRPGPPGRLADGHGEEPRDRPHAAQRAAAGQDGDHGPRPRHRHGRRDGAPVGGGDRGRRPRARLHLLPPGALARGAGRADAADGRRPQDGGDRAGVPGRAADGGAADLARQEDAHRGPGPVRGARGRGARRAAPRRARGRST